MANTNKTTFVNVTLRDGRTFEAEVGNSKQFGDRPRVSVGLVMSALPSAARYNRELSATLLTALGIDEMADWDCGYYYLRPGVNCTVSPVAFKVGEGVSWNGWSDTYPGYVVSVSKSGARVSVQAAKATLLNGFGSGEEDALEFTPGGFVGHTSGRQRYSFEPNPEGEIVTFSRRQNGRFYQVGTSGRNGVRLSAGIAKHHDYNF